jgi:CxxC-x17-CxxC domain-containing protein
VDCARPFVFTVGEQKFHEAKGFANKPTRCPDCRKVRKAMRASSGGAYAGAAKPIETVTATCSNCGGVAELSFVPRGDKPVFCRDCFASRPTYG